jgi:hypothetical protein
MKFGTSGNYSAWAGRGWSAPEAEFTWMEDFEATLEFATPVKDTDMVLAAKLLPLGANVLQKVHVFLNGYHLGFRAPRINTDVFEFKLPVARHLLNDADRSNVLAFVCADAVVPEEVGLGPDQRRLSFAFMQLWFVEAEQYEEAGSSTTKKVRRPKPSAGDARGA